jgi:tetratricopeptide (TPR) repeat protein
MLRARNPLTALPLVALLAACAGEPGEQGEQITAEAGMDVVMVMPVTTSSEAAMAHFNQGQHAMDMGRFIDANEHFEAAVAADPSFAMGHLRVANTANSAAEFIEALEAAEANAEGASEAERIQIEFNRKGLDNDAEGQLQLAQQLVEAQPESPRALLMLAGIQSGLRQMDEARASAMKATQLSPNFVPAYGFLGNNYIFSEPKDFDKAVENMRKVVELAPDEQNSYDFLGDALRAQNDLTGARDAYTRAFELAPDNASPVQQRGHVNSFLGDYDAARADYDASIQRARAGQGPSFAVYRALVSVHAGDPSAAIDELTELAAAIDGMNVPGPRGLKIFALTTAAQIALHHNMFDVAEPILEQRAPLMIEQAEEISGDAVMRGNQANNAYWAGVLAARKGDYEGAAAKAQEFMTLLEPDANPRRNEPAHDLMGLTSLLQGDYAGAIAHYEQANPNNIYMLYHIGLAHEGAGNTAEAQAIFERLVYNNFNSPGYALIRKDVQAKVGM